MLTRPVSAAAGMVLITLIGGIFDVWTLAARRVPVGSITFIPLATLEFGVAGLLVAAPVTETFSMFATGSETIGFAFAVTLAVGTIALAIGTRTLAPGLTTAGAGVVVSGCRGVAPLGFCTKTRTLRVLRVGLLSSTTHASTSCQPLES